MGKVLLGLGIVDVVVGLGCISMQIALYIMFGASRHESYAISVGIWGGIVFLITGAFIFGRKKMPDDKQKIIVQMMGFLSFACGVVMLSLFAWRMDVLLDEISQPPNNGTCFYFEIDPRSSTNYSNDLCSEKTLTALFLVDGILAILVNAAVVIMA